MADEQTAKVDQAVQELALGPMTLGWVLVAETIDEDGNRVLHRLWASSLPAWTIQGYLFSALNDESSWSDD